MFRPSPPFFGMVAPAPPSRYGVLWHTPHEFACDRDIILLAPSARSIPSSLPASPYTPSRSRNSRWVSDQPHLYASHGSACCRYMDPPTSFGSVVWTTRTRGILMEQPVRSRGVSIGSSADVPGRSPTWPASRAGRLLSSSPRARPAAAPTATPIRCRMTVSRKRTRARWSESLRPPRSPHLVRPPWCPRLQDRCAGECLTIERVTGVRSAESGRTPCRRRRPPPWPGRTPGRPPSRPWRTPSGTW